MSSRIFFGLLELVRGILYVCIYFMLKLFPIGACSFTGSLIVRFISPWMQGVNQKLYSNIHYLKPELSGTEIHRLMKRWWDNHGRILTEFPVFNKICLSKNITVNGNEHIIHAKKYDRPIIFTFIHLGNWEQMGPKVIEVTGSVHQIYERLNFFDDLLAQHARSAFKQNLIEANPSAARKALTLLRSGGNLSLAIDEHNSNSNQFPYFNAPPSLSGNVKFALRLAKRTHAIILPCYIRREHGAYFSANFLPPVIDSIQAEDDQWMNQACQQLNTMFKEVISNNLDQWYYLHYRNFEQSCKKN